MSKMVNEEDCANYGGINGIGDKVIDTESEEFKTAQAMIIAHSKKQSPEQRLKTEMLAIKLQMIKYLEEKETDKKLTVGYFLKELLQLLKIRNKTFAEFIGLSKTNLNAIINGKSKINLDLANIFQEIFKIDNQLWLNVQNDSQREPWKNYEVQELIKQSKNISPEGAPVSECRINHKKYRLTDLLEKEIDN